LRTNGRCYREPPGFCAPRLWSLLDIMDNFPAAQAYAALGMLHLEERAALKEALPNPFGFISDDAKAKADKILEECRSAFRGFDNHQVIDRLRSFEVLINNADRPRWVDYEAESRFLRQTLQTELVNSFFYYYPPEKVKYLKRFAQDWSLKDQRLRKARAHALAAVDCYGLNHSTACVFHLMMASEVGVLAFGQQLGVDLAVLIPGRKVRELTWVQVLDALNPKLKALPQTTVEEKRKFERYSAAKAYLHGVADAWRNPTMHPRDDGYNELEAQDILNNVRSFMNHLDGLLRP
jgi:hypothetical protein